MTDTHDTSVEVPTYPDEFKPLIKVINRSLHDNMMVEFLTPDEYDLVRNWLYDFQSLALEFAE